MRRTLQTVRRIGLQLIEDRSGGVVSGLAEKKASYDFELAQMLILNYRRMIC